MAPPTAPDDPPPDRAHEGYVDDVPDPSRRLVHVGVLLALAASAGWVDAAVYSGLTETFVANQSGNVVLLGLSVGGGDWTQAAAAAISICGFGIGLAASSGYRDRRLTGGRTPHPAPVLAIELALLVAVGVLAAWPDRTVGEVDARVLLALAAGSLAMGIQTSVLRRVWGVRVSTTYTSGAVAQISEVEAALAAGSSAQRPLDRRRARVLAGAVVAYALGAAGAVAIGGEVRPFVVPPLVVLAVGVVLVLEHRRSDAVEHP